MSSKGTNVDCMTPPRSLPPKHRLAGSTREDHLWQCARLYREWHQGVARDTLRGFAGRRPALPVRLEELVVNPPVSSERACVHEPCGANSRPACTRHSLPVLRSPPQAPKPWTGELNATAFGASCWQMGSPARPAPCACKNSARRISFLFSRSRHGCRM